MRARHRRVLSMAGVAAMAVLAAGAARSYAAPIRVRAIADTTKDTSRVAAERISIDSLFGVSGKLRARFVVAAEAPEQLPAFAALLGDSLIRTPGVYSVDSAVAGRSFALITMRPFAAKKNGRLGDYRMGTWPYEHRSPRLESYRNPEGFIEVTRENQDTPVSEHFRLRDFLTHDQQSVWPKYLVLEEALIDKLELVISDLKLRGHVVTHVSVMSGFRTPQYNVKGVGRGGRAMNSRHQYGDAADIFVDSDRNGRMDDLNGDGRVDVRDTRIVLQSVERIERQYPDLIGGAGLYPATRAHGPFVHVDVRGNKARWGLS